MSQPDTKNQKPNLPHPRLRHHHLRKPDRAKLNRRRRKGRKATGNQDKDEGGRMKDEGPGFPALRLVLLTFADWRSSASTCFHTLNYRYKNRNQFTRFLTQTN